MRFDRRGRHSRLAFRVRLPDKIRLPVAGYSTDQPAVAAPLATRLE
jgi:hypothetical protein